MADVLNGRLCGPAGVYYLNPLSLRSPLPPFKPAAGAPQAAGSWTDAWKADERDESFRGAAFSEP